MADIDVRHAQKSDIRDLSRTLGRAFHQDPIMTWMLPDAAVRAKGLPRARIESYAGREACG